jgi:hypothetical protein
LKKSSTGSFLFGDISLRLSCSIFLSTGNVFLVVPVGQKVATGVSFLKGIETPSTFGKAVVFATQETFANVGIHKRSLSI